MSSKSTFSSRSLRIETLESRRVLDARVVISEFVANNQSGHEDEDGSKSDWIEIQNAGDAGVSLEGWYLSDDADQPRKWAFPAIELAAEDYLVVFASGKSRSTVDQPLHTNFRLNINGEFLGLTNPDGSLESHFGDPYPEQRIDVSFGLAPDSIPDEAIISGVYFTVPTPGAANSNAFVDGFVADVDIGVERGFYASDQTVQIATETVGATLVYTVDGSTPSLTNGTQIQSNDPSSAPRTELTIAQTTVLRAAAFKDRYAQTSTNTQSYFFLDDIINQSPHGEAPAGWPSRPVNGQIFDYGMDPEIVNDPEYGPLLKDALLDIPTFSLVTDLEHLFDAETGFFVNGETARDDGRQWERPTSFELINPDGTEGFQVDAGVRMRGGFSRQDANPKHAFRLFFRSEYGDAKLEYPLFGEDGVDQFDNIDLRTAQVPSWSLCFPFQSATNGGCRFSTMVRDVVSRDLQGEMGQPFTRSNYYHLYLNGHYWGLFQTQERPEASYAESYFGGQKENYDVIKVEAFPHQIAASDGDLNAWRQLWDLANEGFESDEAYWRAQGLDEFGNRDANLPVLLDTENLIDYMLNIFYGGNLDSPISNFLENTQTNNWFGVRDRTGDEGFKFFIHDAEWTLFNVNTNRLGPYSAGDTFRESNPQWLHQQLMENAEYRLQFADRAQKHLFNGGALTTEASLERITKRVSQIDLAIIAESARWGDAKRASPLTKADWQREIDSIVENHIPRRTDILLQQLKEAELRNGSIAPLYPLLSTPTFSQRGGAIAVGSIVELSADDAIYFTTDGSDPRAHSPAIDSVELVDVNSIGRYVLPADDAFGLRWIAADFDDIEWEASSAGIGFQATEIDFDDFVKTDVGEQMQGQRSSAYLRIPFQLEAPSFDTLSLDMKFNDGFVAYLNGVEVARANAPNSLAWNSTATRTVSRQDAVIGERFDLTPYVGLLRDGENMLAIHGLNRRASSRDFLIAPTLIAGTVTDAGIGATAMRYDAAIAISIASNTKIRARSFNGSSWSALDEATFSVGRLPLNISEIMFHPQAPSDVEQLAGFDDPEDFEFIELMNVSTDESIDLSEIAFVEGIEFEFPALELSPRQRVVVARNQAALEARYGLDVRIVGEYGSNGSGLNNGSETIRLVDRLGIQIQSVQYSDQWHPNTTDGQGQSLEFVSNDFNNTDQWSIASAWAASGIIGGTPGKNRVQPGDANGDGVFNSADLVLVFQAGEYEDALVENSTWREGDWTGDGEFSSQDLVAAFQIGHYQQE